MIENLMDYLRAAYVWAYLMFLDVDYALTGGYVAAVYL